MRVEYNSILSRPTKANKICHFGQYWYIGLSVPKASESHPKYQRLIF